MADMTPNPTETQQRKPVIAAVAVFLLLIVTAVLVMLPRMRHEQIGRAHV